MRTGADFALVDALPHAAHVRNNLPGAIRIVSDAIATEAPRRLPERGRPVVVYWGSTQCKRSEKAAARLARLGYRKDREYVEGDREQADLPLESGPDPAAGE